MKLVGSKAAPRPVFLSHKLEPSSGLSLLVDQACEQHYLNHNFCSNLSKMEFKFKRQNTLTLWSAIEIIGAYLRNFLTPNDRRFFEFSLGGLEIGRFVTSSALRGVSANKNFGYFLIKFHANLLKAAFVLSQAKRNSGGVKAVRLGDVYYLDGVAIEYFLSRTKTWVYVRLPEPNGLVCATKTFDNLCQLQAMLSKQAKSGGYSLDQGFSTLERRLKNPEKEISYYKPQNDGSQLKQLEVPSGRNILIYAHSFSDAQLPFGFDGFMGVKEWLLYTAKTVVKLYPNTNVYVKAHPNFFADAEKDQSGIIRMDREIWSHIKNGLPKQVKVIDSPISNYSLLRQMSSRNTVVITHHGNAALEASFLGFQSISSSASPWGENYDFSHTWRSRKDYLVLLKKMNGMFGQGLSQKGKASALVFSSQHYTGSRSWIDMALHEIGTLQQDNGNEPSRDLDLSKYQTKRLREIIEQSIKTL